MFDAVRSCNIVYSNLDLSGKAFEISVHASMDALFTEDRWK